MPDALVAWEPKRFLIPDDELTDELCWSAILYRKPDGTYYDDSLIRAVTIETTWAIFMAVHKGGGKLTPHKSTPE